MAHIVSALVVVALLAALVTIMITAPPWRRGHPAGYVGVRGADVSFLPREEAAGTVLTDAGGPRPLERILAEHGANYVRLRVWVDPPPGYSDEASALALARRAKNAGLKILLAPHYSDFWADPHSQETPAAWRGDDLDALSARVRGYTQNLVAAFAAQGTPIDEIQIGNEVTNGFLWPLGALGDGSDQEWSSFATLAKAAVAGARDGAGRRHLNIVMHVDTGGDIGRSRYFFDRLLASGVRFDIIGLTYYPFWNGPLAALRANLDMLAARYHKKILVVETGYPYTLAGTGPGDWVSRAAQLPDADELPPTPAGQELFYQRLREVLRQVPDHLGLGFFVWEPGWLTVEVKPGEPDPAANLALFDRAGAGLPGLDAFAPGAVRR
jgi:arabinogalactan endo-1,4-beta-galactosidase